MSRKVVERPPSAQSWEQLWAGFAEAGRYDSTVKMDRSNFHKVLRKYVSPTPYTRENLFSKMLAGEPCILSGFPIPTRGPVRHLSSQDAGPAIIEWLAARKEVERHKVATASTRAHRNLTIQEIAKKWQANRTPFGITDLHVRNTVMEKIIDPKELSAFNILPHSSVNAQTNEIFSLVISSRGHVTDSHSDDPDSSNFCFIGKKLWLTWDTYEGMRRGLQDVERMTVFGQARFDIQTWLSLPSARWFFVNAEETLFLPAHLTHKVITIEPYVGVGGFLVALPNCLRILAHWITRGPLWSRKDSTGENDQLIGEIAQSVRKTILNLREASTTKRRTWGYDYLEESAKVFISWCPAGRLRSLWADPRFRCVADTIAAPWPQPHDIRVRNPI